MLCPVNISSGLKKCHYHCNIIIFDYRSCYWSSLELCRQNDLQTLAFPCISTGLYQYPTIEAADVAIATVREWLLSDPTNLESVDRIVFVTKRLCDEECYASLLLTYFPLVWTPTSSDNNTNSFLYNTLNILFLIIHNITWWFWQQLLSYSANHC